MKDIFTTLLIIFMVLKLIDFHALGILDIMIIILAVLFAVISILDFLKERKK
ncbi:MAG: hypothetical protein ACLSHV_04105 [Hominisplanchenecus sp.]